MQSGALSPTILYFFSKIYVSPYGLEKTWQFLQTPTENVTGMALNLFNYSVKIHGGASPVFPWLRLRASTAEAKVSIPGRGPCFHCTSHGQKKSWVTDLLTPWSFSVNKHVKLLSRVQLFVTPWLVAPRPRLLCAWASPGKNTGVSGYFLLQGILLTLRLNPHLLHWRQSLAFQANSLLLGHQESMF